MTPSLMENIFSQIKRRDLKGTLVPFMRSETHFFQKRSIYRMEAIVAIIIVTTVLYVLAKMIEMKYVDREMRPLKELIRDATIVAVSAGVSTFAVFSMNKSMNGFFSAMTEQTSLPAVAPVFTDNPEF